MTRRMLRRAVIKAGMAWTQGGLGQWGTLHGKEHDMTVTGSIFKEKTEKGIKGTRIYVMHDAEPIPRNDLFPRMRSEEGVLCWRGADLDDPDALRSGQAYVRLRAEQYKKVHPEEHVYYVTAEVTTEGRHIRTGSISREEIEVTGGGE